MEEKDLFEIQVDSEEIFKGKMLHIFKDSVRCPNNNIATREVIRYLGAVAVVPVNENLEVAIERQFRYPLNSVMTEIPAGKLNSAEEDRLEAAKRELREETGLTADKWTDMGLFYPAAAYCDEKITIYLAQGLHQGERELDEDEFINVEFVPLKDLVDDVMNGTITDSKTIAGLLKAARILNV